MENISIVTIEDSYSSYSYSDDSVIVVHDSTSSESISSSIGDNSNILTKTPSNFVPEFSQAAPVKKYKWNLKRSGLQGCLKPTAGEEAKSKPNNKVQFHSPANTKMQSEIIDERMLKGFIEEQGNCLKVPPNCTPSPPDLHKTPKLAPKSTPSNSSLKITCKKAPNFSAIHQKQFEKMESIVEHTNRKKERAKFLIASGPVPKKIADLVKAPISKGLFY